MTSAGVPPGFVEAVDLRDVRMIQRGQHLRFTFEPRQPLGIVGRQRPAEP